MMPILLIIVIFIFCGCEKIETVRVSKDEWNKIIVPAVCEKEYPFRNNENGEINKSNYSWFVLCRKKLREE